MSLVGALAMAPLLLALCAGVATAFYRLGARGLWGDEVWQLAWSQQQPLTDTFLRFLKPPDLPLSFILVQLSTAFSSDPFWVRLPSALLGAATVLVLYLLGRRVFGRATGLAAAFLLAVAPYHVWYAQDARPYAALACYSLLTLLFFERILRRGPIWGNVVGFTLATMLNLYDHLFALFPLLVELCVAVVWCAVLCASSSRPAPGLVKSAYRPLRPPRPLRGGLGLPRPLRPLRGASSRPPPPPSGGNLGGCLPPDPRQTHAVEATMVGLATGAGLAIDGSCHSTNSRVLYPVQGGDGARGYRAWAARALAGIVGGAVVALLAAAPLFQGVSQYILSGGVGGDTSSAQLTSGTVVDLLALFGSGRGWPLPLTAGLAAVGLGVALYRRQGFAGVALAWLALPVAILWLAHPHHMFIPRYVLFMQPVYLLLVAYGLVGLAQGAVALVLVSVGSHSPAPKPAPDVGARKRVPETTGTDVSRAGELASPRRSWDLLRPALVALAVAALGVVTFTPTWRSYAVEKVNDWSAICAYLHRNARLGDVITGNSYTGGLMDWCFKGATDVTLAPPGSYTLPALAASGRDAWYIMVGADSPEVATYLQRHATAIPRTAWDKSGLDPITVYDNRFTYPQGEFPATIYHQRAAHIPSRLAFHETRGASVNPTWPDYAQIGPGGQYIVRLSLPATRPRALTITMLNLVGRNLDIVVDYAVVDRIRPRSASLTWAPVTVTLPAHAGDAILLELRNPGPGVSAVSSVALRYASGRT